MPERERKSSEIRPPCLPPEVRVSTPPVLTAGIVPSDPKSSSPPERITSLDILTFVYLQIRLTYTSSLVLCHSFSFFLTRAHAGVSVATIALTEILTHAIFAFHKNKHVYTFFARICTSLQSLSKSSI